MTLHMETRTLKALEEVIVELLTKAGYMVSIEPQPTPLKPKEVLKAYIEDDPSTFYYRDSYPFTMKEAIKEPEIFKQIDAGKVAMYRVPPKEVMLRRAVEHMMAHPDTWCVVAMLKDVPFFLSMGKNDIYSVNIVRALTNGDTYELAVNLPSVPAILPNGKVREWTVYARDLPDVEIESLLLVYPDTDFELSDMSEQALSCGISIDDFKTMVNRT